MEDTNKNKKISLISVAAGVLVVCVVISVGVLFTNKIKDVTSDLESSLDNLVTDTKTDVATDVNGVPSDTDLSTDEGVDSSDSEEPDSETTENTVSSNGILSFGNGIMGRFQYSSSTLAEAGAHLQFFTEEPLEVGKSYLIKWSIDPNCLPICSLEHLTIEDEGAMRECYYMMYNDSASHVIYLDQYDDKYNGEIFFTVPEDATMFRFGLFHVNAYTGDDLKTIGNLFFDYVNYFTIEEVT